jgi:predicted transcriptional regulator YheO
VFVHESDTKVRKLTPDDRAILERLEPVVKGVAATFGRYCEVVLHSLEDFDRSIVAIENNGVTGREIGAPMTDFAVELVEERAWDENGVVANYTSRTDDGRVLKCTTIVIRNEEDAPIGLLCFNIDTTAPVGDFLEQLFAIRYSPDRRPIEEHYPTTARDLIEVSLTQAMDTVNAERGLSPVERNRAIVQQLYERGIFHVKNAVDIVADDLGISRYTVYNYIRDIRPKTEQ